MEICPPSVLDETAWFLVLRFINDLHIFCRLSRTSHAMRKMVNRYLTIFPIVCWFGDLKWYKDGKLHRDDDKPAWILPSGAKKWYKDGKLHRDGDEPAEVWLHGSRVWYKNGKRHRGGDRPAVIEADGSEEWWRNGKRHRDGDEPAVICLSAMARWWRESTQRDFQRSLVGRLSVREWWKDGEQHRDNDMPTVVWSNGTEEWWEEGESASNPSFRWRSVGIARLRGQTLSSRLSDDCSDGKHQ
jgi:hypothetical protein